MLKPIIAKYGVPGMAAIALQGDRIIAQGVAGVRKAGAPGPITIDDQFHLGSDTKAMTATLIAMLIEEGRLSWSTTIADVFGDTIKDMNPAWKTVTIEQLLTHRAGAPGDLNSGGLWARLLARTGTPAQQRLQLVEGVLSRPPEFPPGSEYLYSNAGYAIAGAMAEKITGQTWEELLQVRLFKPLNITTAGFGAPGEIGKIDQPLGHKSSGEPVEPGPRSDNPPAIAPAGAVHMSMPDWAKFIVLHLRGDPANPNHQATLLSSESFAKLHTPASGPGKKYACGWGAVQRPWAKGEKAGSRGLALTHAGSNTMWLCVTWLAPEKDFAVLIACNKGGDNAAKACDEAAGALLRDFLPRESRPAGQ
ncbi:MAG TPA: serine hydrolase domain-containing protein [Opitutaceae bacterium]|nr:serine hydrolase domain-containing protein [Opitutaceae bacterium]